MTNSPSPAHRRRDEVIHLPPEFDFARLHSAADVILALSAKCKVADAQAARHALRAALPKTEED